MGMHPSWYPWKLKTYVHVHKLVVGKSPQQYYYIKLLSSYFYTQVYPTRQNSPCIIMSQCSKDVFSFPVTWLAQRTHMADCGYGAEKAHQNKSHSYHNAFVYVCFPKKLSLWLCALLFAVLPDHRSTELDVPERKWCDTRFNWKDEGVAQYNGWWWWEEIAAHGLNTQSHFLWLEA